MFTGIVRGVGVVRRRQPLPGGGARLVVEPPADFPLARPGDSIAVDGCCLTVVGTEGGFVFDLAPETLSRTYLGRVPVGYRANLEPALRAGDPIGGHFVTGHVDGIGRVADFAREGDFAELSVALPCEGPGAVRPGLVAEKGSLAVSGVSLTVAAWDAARGIARFALVPETLARTNLGRLRLSGEVHIEYDLLARHLVARLEAAG